MCAQVICLEEMFGVDIPTADFYYYEIRRRIHTDMTEELRDLVYVLAEEMHFLFREGITPPAQKNRKCSLCSLFDVCMPKLTKKNRSVDTYIKNHVRDACTDTNGEL